MKRCGTRTGVVHPRQAAFAARLPWNMLSVSFGHAQAQCAFEKQCSLSQVLLKSPLVPRDQQKSQYKGQESESYPESCFSASSWLCW